MKKTQRIILASFLILTLTGCGRDVVTPEVDQNSEETGTGADIIVERTCSINEFDRCVSQFQMANNDLNTCMAATQKCEQNLQAYAKRESEDQVKTDRLNNIFKNYTETTEQKEYKFDLCGKVGNFDSKPWFNDFKTALETSPIPFAKAGRSLNAYDFTGGCASSEGNIAFFMGAETDGFSNSTSSGSDLFEPDDLFEFHLLKYNIAEKTLQEALMADGLCNDDTCPAIFHSREGASIPMSGVSKDEVCEYKYLFDQNILVKESCQEK